MAQPAPRYFIEIDEEGYPMFDGIRVNDEELLSTIFKGLRRLKPGEFKSPLVSTCEGEICYIVGFSDPLVAQSVEIKGEEIIWHFLGGLSFSLSKEQIKEDEWHRMHAYMGPDQIPSVLSRKAQAEFLHKYKIENFKPKRWRSISADVSTEKFWTDAYANKEDAWDMQGPSPVLLAHFPKTAKNLKNGSEILIPGAGRGHDAIFFENLGYSTTALDFSPTAEMEFHALYSNSKIKFLKDDIFLYLDKNKSAFDGIFEHTIYCAIDPERRREYISKILGALKPGGLWFGVQFLRTAPFGPAFGNTQWEIREMIQDTFNILEWELTKNSHPARMGQEMWAVFQKK